MYRTRQEIYDKVKAHLLTQMARSVRPSSIIYEDNPLAAMRCVYRGPDGLKCAIGALIPDSKYTPTLEGVSVFDIAVARAANIDPDDKKFAQQLQRIHDNPGYSPSEWEAKLMEVAKQHGLNP